MTADRDGAACSAAVVRKPPRNEPRVKCGRRSALSYGDGEGVCDDRSALEGEPGGKQKQVLMVR